MRVGSAMWRGTGGVAAAVAVAAVAWPASAQTPIGESRGVVWTPGSNYPDLSAAPAQEVAEADRLWRRSKRVAKRLFPTVAATRSRGFKGHVRHVHRPKPFFFHLRNNAYHDDGRVLDPYYPEAVVYWYDPPRPMVLVGFMYRVRKGSRAGAGTLCAAVALTLRRLVGGGSRVVHQRLAQWRRARAAASGVRDRIAARLRRPDARFGGRLRTAKADATSPPRGRELASRRLSLRSQRIDCMHPAVAAPRRAGCRGDRGRCRPARRHASACA